MQLLCIFTVKLGRQQVELLDQQYLTGVLADLLNLVEGSGPMNHAFDLKGEYAKKAGA